MKAIEDVLGEQQAELARIERLAATIPTLRRNIACLLRTIEIISTDKTINLPLSKGEDQHTMRAEVEAGTAPEEGTAEPLAARRS